MKKSIKNTTHLEGYVYEHKLELKTSGANSKVPGTEFISGTLSIATDEELMNVVQVHFTYITAVTKSGKPNNTFNLLKSIIDGKIGSVMEHGKENAGMVRVDSAIGLNEWYDTRTPGNPLISVKRNEGGFVHQIQAKELSEKANARATFDVDMLITGATRIEADEERQMPEKVTLKGYVFDFRNSLLPVEFNVYEPYAPPAALDYFEGLGATLKTPIFTHLSGVQVSKTIVIKKEEQGAFGDVKITETRSSQRDFVVNWAASETYNWDEEDGILATELEKAISDRELYLADMKRRQEEYQASKKTETGAFNNRTATVTAPIATDDYDF